MNKIQFIDFLAFYKIKGDAALCAHIIEKFKNGTIKTEKLTGNQNLFAFRVNREQRVICTIAHYEEQTGLIVLELLPHHEYASSKYLNGTTNFDAVQAYEALQIVAQREGEARRGSLPVLPVLGSVRLQDTVILLNPKQLAILDRDEEKPIIIVTGSAGTGKTLIAELLLTKQRHTDYKVLYVTSSEDLVAKVRGDFQKEALCAADIKSFQELCSNLTSCKWGVKGEIDFINWVKTQNNFKDYIKDKSLKDSIEYTARELYEDIRKVQDSRNKNLDELGRKSLHHADKIVESLFDKYIRQLITINSIDLSLTDYPEVNQSLYDCIVVDEAQDFGKCQLQYINTFLRENGHTYFFIDPHQSVFHDFNLIDRYIQTLTNFPEQYIQRYQLMAGYRNPIRVTEFLNEVIKLKRQIIGGRLNQEELTIQSVPDSTDGYLGWIERPNQSSISKENQQIFDSLRQQSEQSIAIAFVVPEASEIKQAQQLFPKGIIFTPETIKGLEFSTIVLLDFLTRKHIHLPIKPLATFAYSAKDNPDRVHFPKSTEQAHHNRFFNRLFVGVSRAMQYLYFIHIKPDNVTQELKKIMENIINDAPSVQNAPLPASTLEEILQFITEHYDRLTLPLLVEYCKRACDKAKEVDKESDLKSFAAIKRVLNVRSESYTEQQQKKVIEQLIKRIDEQVERLTTVGYAIDRLPKRSSTVTFPQDKLLSLQDLKTIDLNEVTAEQLKQVINGKSTLCNVLILRQQDLQGWLKNELGKFDAFVKKITLKALNEHDEKGVSALYWLTYSRNFLEIFNRMVKDTSFIKKISISGLKRLGPRGWSPFLLLLLNENKTALEYLKRNRKLDLEMQQIADSFSTAEIAKRIKLTDFLVYSAIQIAVLSGHLEVVKYLVTNGKNILESNQIGDTFLHFAAINGHLEMIKYLVGGGAKVQEPSRSKNTALHCAASNGKLSVVKYLTEYSIARGHDIGVVNDRGATALHCAVYNGHLPVVKYLVAMGLSAIKADHKGCTALHVAAAHGHKQIVAYLLGLPGVKIDQPIHQGGTALHFSAQSGYLPVVRLLIDNDAKIDSLSHEGATALSLAALSGHLDVVKFLMEHGGMDKIVKQITDQDYVTALNYAIQNKHLPVIQYLVAWIKEITAPDHSFFKYFYKAAEYGHLAVVQWFLEEANVGLNNAIVIELTLEKAKRMQLQQNIVYYLEKVANGPSQVAQLTQMVSGAGDSHLPGRQPSSAVAERANSDTVALGLKHLVEDAPFYL